MPFYKLNQDTVVFKKVEGPETKNGKRAQLLVKMLLKKGQTVRAISDPNNKNSELFYTTQMQSQKCRAATARVLSITDRSRHSRPYGFAHRNLSGGRKPFVYAVGKLVRSGRFDREDKPCAAGIHFFMKKDTALDYNWS